MSVDGGSRVANYQRPVDLLEIARRGRPDRSAPDTEGASFKEMFAREIAGERGVHFSKHASARLYSRGIELSETETARLADAIDKAETKGSRETLVLADKYALVVSVKDRTVVTAFDRDHLREGVVTSIDSAVIL
jgi:flagellar operon protein